MYKNQKIALLWAIMAVLLSLGGTSVVHAIPINALVNPGFETGDFTGWTVGGNSPTVAVGADGTPIPLPGASSFLSGISNVRSGSFSAFAHTRGDPPIVASVTQTISNVLAGNVTVGFYIGHGQGMLLGARIDPTRTMIFIDGVPILANANPTIPGGTLPTDFLLVSGNFVSSGGSHAVTYQWDGSGTFNAGVSTDDLFFNAEIGRVPEPGTVALFALGLAGVGFVRRKKF